MKKIIGLTIAIVLAVGIFGVATFAYFTDTETSTGNTFTAGTLDLKTNDAGKDGHFTAKASISAFLII